MVDGIVQEPYETLILDIEDEHQGKVMESLAIDAVSCKKCSRTAKAERDYPYPQPWCHGLPAGVYLKPLVPALCLLLQQASAPSLLMTSAVAMALSTSKRRCRLRYLICKIVRMMVKPNDVVYEGMIVGIHSRANDLTVNPLKEKKLTNIRFWFRQAIILTHCSTP